MAALAVQTALASDTGQHTAIDTAVSARTCCGVWLWLGRRGAAELGVTL
ncbi:hypothetical protein OH799_11255 [Nocardia sp. NBC_00881]|nr:hypothetical protein OH799_11255 [Nocardia sp. NBC_00881]